MNDRATTVTIRDDLLQQDSNLRIAGSEEMFLNAAVDSLRAQVNHRKLLASAGGLRS